MGNIKFLRAKSAAKLGLYHRSFEAMWGYLPANVTSSLSSSQLADLVDGFWACAQNSRAIGERGAIANGIFVQPYAEQCVEFMVE